MPDLPQVDPQECRRRAEEFLREDVAGVDTGRAAVWGLLAVAGELHEIRRLLTKNRR